MNAERENVISALLSMLDGETVKQNGCPGKGSRVDAIFEEVAAQIDKRTTKDGETVFFWLPKQNPPEYEIYRVEDESGSKRSMDDISSYEILIAVKEVLLEQISLTKDDLVRETAKKFGYSRLGNVIEQAVNHAIDCGVRQQRLKLLEDGKVILR